MVALEIDEDFAMLKSVLDLPEMLDAKEDIESEGEETGRVAEVLDMDRLADDLCFLCCTLIDESERSRVIRANPSDTGSLLTSSREACFTDLDGRLRSCRVQGQGKAERGSRTGPERQDWPQWHCSDTSINRHA